MTQMFTPGKDTTLEDSITCFQQKLLDLRFDIEEASWLSPVPRVWSVHIRDKECVSCFTNGKDATKRVVLVSALGEYFECLSIDYFFVDSWLGDIIVNGPSVHCPNEERFPLTENDDVPEGLLDVRLLMLYDPNDQLTVSMLADLQSGNNERDVCGLPPTRQPDGETVYIPMSIVGNLHVSGGMSAGNTPNGACVQGLSEVSERHIKNCIITESTSLPEAPVEVMARYPGIVESITKLEAKDFPIFVYDGSLGDKYPAICVVLFSPTNGTCFASFGAYPNFGVVLERTATELLQGRSLKDLGISMPPTSDDEEVAEHASLETCFIDSSGLISQDMFRQDADHPFIDQSFSGTTEEEFITLMTIFKAEDKEVHIVNYKYLGIYTCRIIVPGMLDIYPAGGLWLADNSMSTHLRGITLSPPDSEWEKEDHLVLIEQIDGEDPDDFTRVRELLGLATGKDNGWYTLHVGELKAMLALTGGDLEWVLI